MSKRFGIITLIVILSSISNYTARAQTMATNPVLWTDVPDPDIIRVGNTYYMTSTTMHFNPGVPIMKSTDLVTWETVGYVYDILTSNNNTNLLNGSNMYGKGSWASCLRYANGYYYVYFLSYTTNATHVYRTKDIENGPWTGYTISRGMHDLSVLFDDDGRVYAFYGSTDIHIVELTADGLAIKSGGVDKILISNAGSAAGTSFIVNAEGSHIYKINGTYFLTLISWPNGSGRTELAYRASSLTGTWEGTVLLSNNGVAQGGIVSTPAGKWYGLLFRDNGSVGRIPYLTQVTWTNNWPMMTAPATLDIAASAIGLKGIIASDDFNYSSPVKLNTAWQWNHNPDNTNWSMTARPGYFRIATSRVDANIYSARNTLTQRTYGPTSTGVVAIDVTNMKDGDYAGLSAFQDKYGFVGVKMSGTTKTIVMVNASSGTLTEVASAALTQNTVYLRVDCNFANQTDKATFYYSTNGTTWTALGNTLQMSFELTHFVGYRFALFNYSTKTAGGYVDFDYFKTGSSINNMYPFNTVVSAPTVTSPVIYCQNTTATVLTATGTALKWYSVATGGTALTTTPIPSTTIAGTTTYYVSQTVNAVESQRAAIAVNVNATPALPIVTTPINYIQNSTSSALTATGTALKWYTVATAGTALTAAPIPSTTAIGTVNYYVSQTVNTCESPRASIAVIVSPASSVTLVTGWNVIGCPISGSTDIATALSSIWSQIETVKTQDAFYSTINPSALNSLTKLNWGQGYLVKVKTPCTLIWK